MLKRKKTAPIPERFLFFMSRGSALAGFEPTLRFVDHVNAAFSAHNTAVAVPVLERAERIANLHGRSPHVVARASALVTGSTLACANEFRWWAILGSNQ